MSTDDLETWKTRAQQAEMVLREVRTALDGTAHDWLPALAKHRMAQRSADLAVAKRCVSERMAMAEALGDLQRSIASALFEHFRDDARVPPDRISAALIDSLQHRGDPETSVYDAESFLLEEEKRHG